MPEDARTCGAAACQIHALVRRRRYGRGDPRCREWIRLLSGLQGVLREGQFQLGRKLPGEAAIDSPEIQHEFCRVVQGQARLVSKGPERLEIGCLQDELPARGPGEHPPSDEGASESAEGQGDIPDRAKFAIDPDRAAYPTDLTDSAPLCYEPLPIQPKQAVGIVARGRNLRAPHDAMVTSDQEGDGGGGCHLPVTIGMDR